MNEGLEKEISILGCGWLGMALVSKLSQKGYDVKGSTTSSDKLVKIKFNGAKPYLIHLDKIDNSLSEFLTSEILAVCVSSKNIDQFINLIHEINSSKIKKVVFISSTSVYINSNKNVDEKSEIKDSPLARIENIFKTSTKFRTTIIRFGGLFGYDRKPVNFISFGKKIENPDGVINLIHRDDCIRIIERLIEKDIWNETFNACSSSHPTRREFYTNEYIKLGKESPEFNESSLNEYKIVNSNKLVSRLDYDFRYANLLNYE